jgi:hypothetical protein
MASVKKNTVTDTLKYMARFKKYGKTHHGA